MIIFGDKWWVCTGEDARQVWDPVVTGMSSSSVKLGLLSIELKDRTNMIVIKLEARSRAYL